jgi:hypothetical protein
VDMLSLQEVGVTVASFMGHGAFGSTSVFGMPVGLFVFLLVVVDVVIACVIIVAAMKLQHTSQGKEGKEVLREIELTEIKGIGPRKAEELKAVGVNAVSDLAKASAKGLSQKTGISEKIISRWIVEAKRMQAYEEVLSKLRQQDSSS